MNHTEEDLMFGKVLPENYYRAQNKKKQMKKVILFLGLALISVGTFAQSAKKQPAPVKKETVKKDTAATSAKAVKKDTAKVDTLLHMPTMDRATAKVVLEAMGNAMSAVPQSDLISAKSANQSVQIYRAFIDIILKRYPDLVPKQK